MLDLHFDEVGWPAAPPRVYRDKTASVRKWQVKHRDYYLKMARERMAALRAARRETGK